jgi:hypothetical protein
MAANFLALPAELRLMVYSHILSASSPFDNLSTILALRLSCRRVNLDITHEFITAVTAYHTGKLAASQYYTFSKRFTGPLELEKIWHPALENVVYTHPKTFVDTGTLKLEIQLQEFLYCARLITTHESKSFLFPLWELLSELPKPVRKIVIIIKTGVATARNGAPAWFDLVHACSHLSVVAWPPKTKEWPLDFEVHWSVPVKELPRLKSGASLRFHYRRKRWNLQEEGEKTVLVWRRGQEDNQLRLVFGSSGP